MADPQTLFIALGAIGFSILALSLVLGEFLGHGLELGHGVEPGHGLETGHDAGHDGFGSVDGDAPTLFSIRVLSAALVGFGAAGFVADSAGLPAWVSWPAGLAGFLAVGAGTYSLVLRPLAAQQYNSLMSRYNYVGRDAVVSLEILPGGTGQVTFTDRQGARITQTASCDTGDAVAKGSAVTIIDLSPGGVIVHRSAFSS